MSSAAVEERVMVKRNDVSVKIDEEVARKARLVAEFEGKGFSAFLSELLDPILDEMLRGHARHLLEPKPKGKGKGEGAK